MSIANDKPIFREERPCHVNERLSTLMSQSQEGDGEAYHELLEEVSRILSRFLLKRIHRSEEVDDVLQEILISIHGARHTYDPARPFLPWMYSIAQRRVVDYIRAHSRKAGLEVRMERFDPESIPAMELETNPSRSEELSLALETLNEKQRRIVRLLKIEGWSVKEVAEELQMGLSAVKVAAHRAYRALGQQLEKKNANP